MVDINEVYKSQSDYIKAEDIGHQMWTFTIRTADVKTFDNGDSKIVLTFDEWDKGLPLNVTNARAIADLYGHNSNAWIGKQIMLFSMPVKFQDRMVDAVRIRAPASQGQPLARKPAPVSANAQYDEQNPPPAEYADYRA